MRDRHPTHGHDHSHGVSDGWITVAVRNAAHNGASNERLKKFQGKMSDRNIRNAGSTSASKRENSARAGVAHKAVSRVLSDRKAASSIGKPAAKAAGKSGWERWKAKKGK